ncbi:MAG: hypothetical protein HYR85_09500 [Planctomycetes bacterium]|nr:hypothetical protein [Planctomycetota bacterium]MBI3847669.1 hypothetical protein [Planctomycetota bacterium]
MTITLRPIVLVAALGLSSALSAHAQMVFEQPPNPGGGLIASSWVDPDGTDADMYVYDSFILPSDTAITEVRWRGGYIYGGTYGLIHDFSITFFESIAGGSQPHVTNPQLPEIYLARYDVGGVAGETPAGTFGGIPMYDYGFALPTAFQATGGVKYWIRIEGFQAGYPDWGITLGMGGDSSHFQFSTGAAMFSFGGGDAAFSLYTTPGPSYVIAASASPSNGGTITGAGSYPGGSVATLAATPNAGFGFVNWTESGTPVSNSATYNFTVNANRTLVAHFVAAYTITTSSSPAYGGSTSGGGVHNGGSSVTVVATANPGFVFVNWTEFGTPVSTAASYTFTATADRTLAANFTVNGTGATFDFDTGTPALFTGQGIPFDQTASGVTAHFSSPEGLAFSTQSDSSTQWHMSQFSGLYLYANNQNRNHLDVQFDHALTHVTLTFATSDNHQTELTTLLQLSAFMDSTSNPPVGVVTARGTYGSDTFPMGTVTFISTAPFNLIELVLPYQPLGVTAFFVDNIAVTTTTCVPASGAGTVDAGAGGSGPVDVLLINGSGGGSCRVFELRTTDPLVMTIDEPPSRVGLGATYAIYAWMGEPAPADATALPRGIGTTCMPTPLTRTHLPQPSKRANTIGSTNQLGVTNWPGAVPRPAPHRLLNLPTGVGATRAGLHVFFQGVIQDNRSAGTVGYSVTNGLVLRTIP